MGGRTGGLSSKSRARVVRALIRRDGLVCCFCGGRIDPKAPHNTKGRLSVEHVVPVADGGTNRLTNLKLAHRGCNNYHGGHRNTPRCSRGAQDQPPGGAMDDIYAVLDGPHIEGLPGRPGDAIPLVSHIEGNLYMGGCRNGVRLPDDFRFVLSLYPWEQYELGPDTERVELRLYDSVDLPDPEQLRAAVAHVLDHLPSGKVLVHCQAGLNRSGLISALVLMARGDTAKKAIALLRERRDPYVLCNRAFEAWLVSHDAATEERAA